MRVYRDAIPMPFVASIVLSVGVGFPGGSVAAALDDSGSCWEANCSD
jgi:hypothetical protein